MLTVEKVAKGKGNFYIVTFSNKEKVQLSEDAFVRYRLLKGQELTEERLKEIKATAGYDLGLQLAYHYLSYQIHTEKEVFTYLKEKEISLADSKKIMEKLRELALVDDRRFGENYVRTQVRLSDKGPNFLAQQLRQKGLKPEDIEAGLAFYPLSDQLEVALRTAEKILKKQRNKSSRERFQKAKQQLMQKGFSQEVINEVLAILTEEPNPEAEYESLVFQGDKLWQRNQRLEIRKRQQKVKQSLYQKGFSFELIQRYLEEKVEFDE
ncbi:regulatory protein [Enterococcus sp. PF1-24]|uniref:RecX family transcriptional regulator n=1 Tax=unclassified Enterococcus TaxID=2608891 RepID=UPI0024731E14|nr:MULTISPECIES: RecX family transcriptional regulator [unclassified Enterococcus]MDH6363622.1 regulatory protein [Enterococcus sp. PFB1-1]MDH6400857.1 regulatory protein [Enterococcus sp. PF1-24]